MSSNLFKMGRNASPIGERLVEAYKNKGITTKREISESLGFKSENAIYKVLSGDRELSFDSLRRFAETTGKSIHWLLTGEEHEQVTAGDFRLETRQMVKRLRDTFPGMKADEIAARLNVKPEIVTDWFNGTLPATESLAKIAEQTGVSLKWLLSNQGPQWAEPIDRPGGEKDQGLTEHNGFSPRQEAVRPSPETQGSEERLILAHLQLIIEQNNRTMDQNSKIIQLLEAIEKKTL